MTKGPEPNPHVMVLLNLGLMKIRLVSASDLFFLLSADAPFIPVHRTGFSDAILIMDAVDFLSTTELVVKKNTSLKSRFTKLSLRVKRSSLAFFGEIATPACRNFWLAHQSQAGTSACRHAPFPAFGGTRNDTLAKGFPF